MTPATTVASPARSTTGFGSLLIQGLIGGALAGVINLVLYFATSAAGVSYTGDFNGMPSLPVSAIFISGVVMALPATGVAWLANKFTSNGARLYLIIAVVFDLLSLGGPAGVKGLSTGGLITMEVMHLVAGAAIVALQLRAMRKH